MVRLYRTFSNLIYTVGTRCVGYLYTVSEWFNPLEPPRTFSNHFSAEKERCVEVFDVSSGGFDRTEPSLSTSYEFWGVRLYRTFSIYVHRYRGNKVCRVLCTCSGWFKHIEPRRTFSNHIITKIARCVEFCHMSSGWFDCTEHSLSTLLQHNCDMTLT